MFTFYTYFTAVFMKKFFAKYQAQAGAGFIGSTFGGKEIIAEEFVHIFRADTCACILYKYTGINFP